MNFSSMTTPEILAATGLDWRVQTRGLAMRSADGQQVISEPLSGYRAVVRSDTDEVFQVATKRYNPLQNESIVNFFREYCDKAGVELAKVGHLAGGSKVYAQARLNRADANIDGDNSRAYLMMATSHDGSIATCANPTSVWIICENTLAAAIAQGSRNTNQWRMKHTRAWSAITADEARATMDRAVSDLQSHHERCAKFAKVTMGDSERVEFVTRVLGGESALDLLLGQRADTQAVSLLDSIVDGSQNTDNELSRTGRSILEAIISSPGATLPSRAGTLWGAINGVTYFADHLRGRNAATRADSATFGPGATLKARALEVAAQMIH